MPSTSAKQHKFASDCPKCNGNRIWKPASRDGKMWRQYCSSCHSKQSYASRKLRSNIYNLQVIKRRQTEPKFRAYELWHGARSRASMRNIEFDIERSFVENALINGRCQVTGLRFNLELKQKRMGSMSPSIDRIDPKYGYIPGNVQVVCWLYNRAKGDGNHADVLKLVEALGAIEIKCSA